MSRGFAGVGLFNAKNAMNIGGAMRAAFNYEAAFIGVAGTRYQRIPTDTIAAWKHIPLVHTEDILSLCPHDCVPVAIELVDGARSLPMYTHPERAFYVFGPEDGSIPARIVERCRDVVAVPTRNCMNLAATVNVVLYDRLAKQMRDVSRENRDARMAKLQVVGGSAAAV